MKKKKEKCRKIRVSTLCQLQRSLINNDSCQDTVYIKYFRIYVIAKIHVKINHKYCNDISIFFHDTSSKDDNITKYYPTAYFDFKRYPKGHVTNPLSLIGLHPDMPAQKIEITTRQSRQPSPK